MTMKRSLATIENKLKRAIEKKLALKKKKSDKEAAKKRVAALRKRLSSFK